MPRKPSAIPAAVRIRENQRRARARRRELIDELKTKNRECVLQGTMATVEMQGAARKVMLENKRLRALLSEKGVSTAEIEAFLSNPSSPTPGPADINGAQGEAAPSVDLQHPSEAHMSVANHQSVSAALPPAMPKQTRSESARQDGKNHSEYTRLSNDVEHLRSCESPDGEFERGSPLLNILGPVSDCYCPEVDVVPGPVQSSETECSVAATILASFRGHGDVEQLRNELGCVSDAPCSIKNIALLNTLDSEHPNTI